MKQFTTQQLTHFRQRVANQPELIEHLKTENEVVLTSPMLVPASGIATWNLYYYCPDHGVRLEWDRQSAKAHRCPVDGHLFTGEPYDGAWWREMNGLNAKGCYQIGLLWQLTGEQRYLEIVSTLLTRYATHYPDYQEHGGIPYNGPGKMNAQTLCEANCLLDFALGYDLVSDALTPEQREHIVTRLLRCAAAFLMSHRTPQLHNHEVKINSTVGVIGFILEDEAMLEFAVNGKYGLRWQLEKGLFAEGLWFEGSVHYHFYALQGFFAFEKLARNTRWSLLDLPFYRKMLTFPLQILMPDATFPRLNDCIAGQEELDHSHIYEFAWACYKDEYYAAALRHIYRHKPRCNIDALLYGEDTLPETQVELIPSQHLHAPDCGLTIWRNAGKRRALLIKHTPYGGEHDHYDRLNLTFFNLGEAILPDLGTTGYGAKMHYAYYKNSATHNTLSVNHTNQPPALPVVLHYHQGDHACWLDTEVDWRKTPPPLDSYTRIEWDSNAWRDIRFRRRLLWLDDAIIDISTVDNPHGQQLDWTLHLAGKALDATGAPATFANHGPLTRMHDTTVTPLIGSQPRHFALSRQKQALWLYGEAMLWQGLAPDNPAVQDISYLVLRSDRTRATFICVWDLGETTPITDVHINQENDDLRIRLGHGQQQTVIDVSNDAALLPEIHLATLDGSGTA